MRPLHHGIARSVALRGQQQTELQLQIQGIRMISANGRGPYFQGLTIIGFGVGHLALRLRKLRSGFGDD